MLQHKTTAHRFAPTMNTRMLHHVDLVLVGLTASKSHERFEAIHSISIVEYKTLACIDCTSMYVHKQLTSS